MAKTHAHNLVYLHRDRGYRFTDRDPAMEELCDIIEKRNLSAGAVAKLVYDASKGKVNLHYRTVENWLNGKTKKPQNYTLDWAGYALGLERKWRPIKEN